MNRNEQKCSNCTRGDWGRELGPENTHQYFVKFLVHTCHAPSLINGVNIDRNTAIVRLPPPQTHSTTRSLQLCRVKPIYCEMYCMAESFSETLLGLWRRENYCSYSYSLPPYSQAGQCRGLLWMFRDQFQLMLLPLHHSKWSVGSQFGKYTLYTAKINIKVWTYLHLFIL